ncbi:MAG: HD domain-containing protein [Acetatifactor sp.]|nr:HD domain-containing protein [Acetatifactor sp.]
MTIMKRKKSPEDGREIPENKGGKSSGKTIRKTIGIWALELVCGLLALLGIVSPFYIGVLKQGADRVLCYMVLIVLGIAVMGFCLRRAMLRGDLDYDNSRHPGRFLLCFLMGLVVALVCVFLPVAAWPFLPVYVLLALFGSLNLGVLGATVLLAIPVCLTGAGMEVFLMYFISGLFGAALFQHLKNGFRAGIPFLFSLGSLLVCETAGTVLVMNARPEFEHFVLPAANLVVSGVLLVGILRLFSDMVIYRYRGKYLDLNDPENEILAAVKQKDRQAYMKSVHTAYFCERIAVKLGLNSEPIKCAGYYHDMGEELPELMKAHSFPPEVVTILEEYQDQRKPMQHKGTAVLLAAENVISAVLRLLEETQEGKADYDRVIDEIFESYRDKNTFRQCDITVKELYTMHKIFKEEKLYYDFLR